MDWDDEYNEEYDDAMAYDDVGYASHRDRSMPEESGSEGGLDPMDIKDPASAYFFLSDDAQDKISGKDKKKMKCLSCGHRFTGEIYESCPECHSVNTEEAVIETNDGYW
jgi:hypothetical protein